MKKRIFSMILMAMFMMMMPLAHAENFDTAFQKTVSEIPDGADAAALGGATTATPDFSSRNPAIIAVEPESKEELFQNGIYANYGYIHFEKGPRVMIGTLSGTKKLPVGVLQITGSYATSSTAEMSEFDNFKINSSPSVQIQYGLPVIIKDLYVGASYEYSQSKITAHSTFIDPLDTEIKTESEGNTFGVGALYRYRMSDKKFINVGTLYVHSWDSDRTYVDGLLESKENSQTDQIRFGVSVNVTSMTMLSAEIRQYWFPDGVNNTQFFAGIEQYLIKDTLAVYGGYANGGLTTGLGVYLKHGGLNLAYMNRPFQSTEEWLGRAEALMLSVYVTF